MIFTVEFTRDNDWWYEAAEFYDLDEAENLQTCFLAEHQQWDFVASRIVGHLGNSNKVISYSKLI